LIRCGAVGFLGDAKNEGLSMGLESAQPMIDAIVIANTTPRAYTWQRANIALRVPDLSRLPDSPVRQALL